MPLRYPFLLLLSSLLRPLLLVILKNYRYTSLSMCLSPSKQSGFYQTEVPLPSIALFSLLKLDCFNCLLENETEYGSLQQKLPRIRIQTEKRCRSHCVQSPEGIKFPDFSRLKLNSYVCPRLFWGLWGHATPENFQDAQISCN